MKREVKIGIFAVAMILLAWGGIRFLSGLDIFSRNATYVAVYDQVNGVQEASAVIVKGVKVGSVTGIELDPSDQTRVAIRLNVRRDCRIPNDSEARIFSDGLLGGKAIEIVYGRSAEMLSSGDTICSSYTNDLMQTAGSELAFFKEKFSVLADDLSRLLGNLNTIMEENAQNLKSTMGHVESITDDVALMLDKERVNIERAVEGLTTFSTMLGNNAERVDSLIGGVNNLVAGLDEGGFSEKLSSTLSRLDSLLAGIEQGEGSIGSLMNDRAMYDNLTEASANLSALLADLKEHPARYVHLSVFGKDSDKAAKKEAKKAAKAEAKAAKKEAKKAAKESAE